MRGEGDGFIGASCARHHIKSVAGRRHHPRFGDTYHTYMLQRSTGEGPLGGGFRRRRPREHGNGSPPVGRKLREHSLPTAEEDGSRSPPPTHLLARSRSLPETSLPSIMPQRREKKSKARPQKVAKDAMGDEICTVNSFATTASIFERSPIDADSYARSTRDCPRIETHGPNSLLTRT